MRPVDLAAVSNGSGGAADVGAYEASVDDFSVGLLSSSFDSNEEMVGVSKAGEEIERSKFNAAYWHVLRELAFAGETPASRSLGNKLVTGDGVAGNLGLGSDHRTGQRQVGLLKVKAMEARDHALADAVDFVQRGRPRSDDRDLMSDSYAERSLDVLEIAIGGLD